MSGLRSSVASVRRRAVDRMFANPWLFGDLDHPLAPARRPRRGSLRKRGIGLLASGWSGKRRPNFLTSGLLRLSGSAKEREQEAIESLSPSPWRRRPQLSVCGRPGFGGLVGACGGGKRDDL